MSEKIRTDSEEFRRAVARGDTRQLEEWDSQGLIQWNAKNFVAKQLSEEAQAKRRAAEEAEADGEEATRPPSRVDRLVGKDERLSHSHPAVQAAVARGDSQLLAELIADERYEPSQGSGPFGSFTWGDIQDRNRRDAS